MAFNYEEVSEESLQHSKNTSDWTNEALIKNLLWAEYSYQKNLAEREENITGPICDRCSNALCELTRRVKAINEEDFQKNMETIHYLIIAQHNMAEHPCASSTVRNIYLRQLEDIFNSVKKPNEKPMFISDVWLP